MRHNNTDSIAPTSEVSLTLNRRQLLGLLGVAGLSLSAGYGCASGSGISRPISSTVLNGSTLSRGYDLGLNTSGNLTNWLSRLPDSLRMDYPAGQLFGVVFVVVDSVTADISARQTLDFSAYTNLLIDLKGEQGGEQVSVGVKTKTDPDDGTEPKFSITNISTNWQTYTIPLTALTDIGHPASRFKDLYLVCEIVFENGTPPETVFCRSIRFQ